MTIGNMKKCYLTKIIGPKPGPIIYVAYAQVRYSLYSVKLDPYSTKLYL